MYTLILPCCGQSTRYGLDKPKYLLPMPNGQLMIQQAIAGLDLSRADRIVWVTLAAHAADPLILPRAYPLTLQSSANQVDTVCQAIQILNLTGAIIVKDCDNYFETTLSPGNFICVSQLDREVRADNKAYIKGDVIKEKEIISDLFCCGAYGWSQAQDLLSQRDKEYMSQCIIKPFSTQMVSNYKDWGTIEEYRKCFRAY